MSFGPEHKSTFAESLERMLEPEPLAYKFVGGFWTWLCDEFDEDPETTPYLYPMYAPIEDEI